MRLGIKILAIIVFCAVSAQLQANILTIKIPQRVTVNTQVVCLGDIASNKKELPSNIQKLVIGNIVIPGASLQISKEYLLARLSQSEIDPKTVILLCPKKITIVRKFIKISSQEITEIAKHCISEYAPWSSIKIEQLKAQGEVILPFGKVTYQCLPPAQSRYIGSFSLPILFKVDGRERTKTWVIAKTKVILKAIVAAQNLNRGKIVTKQDIQVKKMEFQNPPSNLISNLDEVIGKRTKRFIRIGSILTKADIEKVPVIKRGSKVTIVVESPVLKITAPGKAKEDGCKGDVIKVLNLSSKKTIYATVINAHIVKVGF